MYRVGPILVIQLYCIAKRRNICLATCSLLHQSRSHILMTNDIVPYWTVNALVLYPFHSNFCSDVTFSHFCIRCIELTWVLCKDDVNICFLSKHRISIAFTWYHYRIWVKYSICSKSCTLLLKQQCVTEEEEPSYCLHSACTVTEQNRALFSGHKNLDVKCLTQV